MKSYGAFGAEIEETQQHIVEFKNNESFYGLRELKSLFRGFDLIVGMLKVSFIKLRVNNEDWISALRKRGWLVK